MSAPSTAYVHGPFYHAHAPAATRDGAGRPRWVQPDKQSTIYAILSKATHTTVRDLEVYLQLDGDDEIQSIEYAPSMQEIPRLLLNAAHCIVLAAAPVAGTFEIDIQSRMSEHLEFIRAKFKSLNEAYPS